MKNDLSEKEFINRLRFIRPSKAYNKELMKEIEERELLNNIFVLKYLNELQELNICKYEVQCLLLTQFDPANSINKFIKIEREYKETQKKNYRFKNVIESIKTKQLTPDFNSFIDAIESILMSTKSNQSVKDDDTRVLKVQINHKIMSDFLILCRKFMHKHTSHKCIKGELALINDLSSGTMSYREGWLYVFESKLISDYILFVFYFLCLDNLNVMKYQILRNMIEERIGGENLDIFKEANGRYQGYLTNKTFVEQYKEFTTGFNQNKFTFEKPEEKIEKPEKARKEILDWCKAREKAFTETIE
ncbi:hypothetical protein NGRA_0252 [Nosema granulosis]|uniref:Uncharacterized protein n=1 Tax=Nosema granulosis TaxID=83296 RepID=A0A9P6L0Q8_9MICR|nr:hypothetical protein NGRA_0252 [Nosema granulosis]